MAISRTDALAHHEKTPGKAAKRDREMVKAVARPRCRALGRESNEARWWRVAGMLSYCDFVAQEPFHTGNGRIG